jgi:hypothetical protein
VLLLLANFGKEGKPEAVIPHITQETLAEMTRRADILSPQNDRDVQDEGLVRIARPKSPAVARGSMENARAQPDRCKPRQELPAF